MGTRRSLSFQQGLALSGRAGAYYCASIAGLAVGSRILGRQLVSAAWEGGACVLLMVLLGLAWRGHAFSSILRGIVAVCVAVVVSALSAFVALIVLVNVQLALGMGL